MEIKHIYPHYEDPSERTVAIQELNAELAVKLYNKRKMKEKTKKQGDYVGGNRNSEI